MRTANIFVHVLVSLSLVFYTLAAGLLAVPSTAHAQVGYPTSIGFQGRLKNSSSQAISSGTYDFRFNLYTASSGGTATNSSDIDVDDVTVTNGFFSLSIPLGTDIGDFIEDLYLDIQVKADAEGSYESMSSRVQILKTPYSVFSQAIENAASAPSNAFAGRMYFDTTANDVQFYNGSAWKSLASNLDDAYDNFGSSAQLITVDDDSTGIEFSVESGDSGDFVVDLQSDSDFVVQDAGSAWAQFTDGQAFDVDGTGAISLDADAASNFNTSAGDLTFDAEAGSVVIDGGEAAADAVNIDASNAAGGITIDAGSNGVSVDATGASNFTTSSGALTLDGGSGVNIAGNASEVDVTTSGAVDVNATSGAITLDAGASSNFTTSAGDLTLAASAAAASIVLDGDTAAGVLISIDNYHATNNTTGKTTIDTAELEVNAYGLTGAGVDINALGGNVAIDTTDGAISLTAGGASGGITIASAQSDVTLDTNTASKNIKIGTQNVSRTIDIGVGTAADTINIATAGTSADILNIGNSGVADTINITSGAATDDVIDLTVASLTTGSALHVDSGSTFSGSLVNLDTAAAFTGNMLAFDNTGDAAWTGNMLDITSGTSTTASGNLVQMTLESGAESVKMFDLNIEGTNQTAGDGWLFDIDVAGDSSDALMHFNFSEDFGGSAITVTDDTSNSAYTALNVDIQNTGAAVGLSLANAAHATGDLGYIQSASTRSAGNILDVNDPSTATASQPSFDYDLTGASDQNYWDITASAAWTGNVWDFNNTAISTGNVIDVTYSTAAATGNAIDLNMGTNVAGDAININTAATTGSAIEVVHSAGDTSNSGLLYLQNTDGTLTAQQYLIRGVYTDDGDSNGDFILFEDNAGDDQFLVANDGGTTITGTAGSPALTVVAGDGYINDGALTILDADNDEGLEIINSTLTTRGATTSDQGLARFAASGLTTGSVLTLSANETNMSGGFYLKAHDQVGNTNVFTVQEDGLTTIAGSADDTDALVITAGDILVSDGDLDVSGGDFNVVLDAGDGASIDGSTTNSTVDVLNVSGSVASGNDGVDALRVTHTLTDVNNAGAINVSLVNNDDGTATDTIYGAYISLDDNSTLADDTVYGLYMTSTDNGTSDPDMVADAFIVLNNSDTTAADLVTDGVLIASDGGAITDAIDASDSDIVNALNVGSNDIVGSTGLITYSGATTWSSSGGDVAIAASGANYDVVISAGDSAPSASEDGNDIALEATDDILLQASGELNSQSAGRFTLAATAPTAGSTISVAADADAEDLTIQTTGSDGDVVIVSVDDLSLNGDGLNQFVTSGGSSYVGVTDTGDAGTYNLYLYAGNSAIGGATADGDDVELIADDDIILAASGSLTTALADNTADAYDLQEGTNNYININTTNTFEAMQFGNATTDPSFTFLGSGLVGITGSADGTDALSITAGDLTIGDGDLHVSGGDFNVTLDAADGASITNTAASSVVAGLTIEQTTAASDTAGSAGLDVTLDVNDYADDGAADTHAALQINTTNDSSDTGTEDNVYGLYLTDLAGSGGETARAIYQAGTSWDYGLYVEDRTLFGGIVETYFDGASQYLDINAGSTTPVTNTNGVVDIDINAGNAAVIGQHVSFTVDNGATAATEYSAQTISLTADDADADIYGLIIDTEASVAAAAGSFVAAIAIDNAENTFGSMEDGIIIESTGIAGGITDAIDVSDSNIGNGLNLGENDIVGTTASWANTGALSAYSTAGNVLISASDSGNAGTFNLSLVAGLSNPDAGEDGDDVAIEAEGDVLVETSGDFDVDAVSRAYITVTSANAPSGFGVVADNDADDIELATIGTLGDIELSSVDDIIMTAADQFTFNIADNDAPVFDVTQGDDSYISIETTNGDEIVAIGDEGQGTEIDLDVYGQLRLIGETDDTQMYFELPAAVSSATNGLMRFAWDGATTIDGDLTGIDMDLFTSVTGANAMDVIGYQTELPALAATGATTTNYVGFNVAQSGAITTSDASATTVNWFGLSVDLPNITASNGNDQINSTGIYIAGGTQGGGDGFEAETGILFDSVDQELVISNGDTLTVGASAQTWTADIMEIGDNFYNGSATDGTDALVVTMRHSDASGTVLHLMGGHEDDVAGTTSETYDIIKIANFAATINASGDETTVGGLNIGNLTETETTGDIDSDAVRVGTGWDYAFDSADGRTRFTYDGAGIGEPINTFTSSSESLNAAAVILDIAAVETSSTDYTFIELVADADAADKTVFSVDSSGNTVVGLTTDGAFTSGLCHSGSDIDDSTNLSIDDSDFARVIVPCDSTPGDFAEWYETESDVGFADVVSFTNEMFEYTTLHIDPFTGLETERGIERQLPVMKKATIGDGMGVFGIVSTSPIQTIGASVKEQGDNPMPIALNGRVPVKFVEENGPIEVGDYLSASSTAGHAMKAQANSQVIGVALSPSSSGQVIAFVKNFWWDGTHPAAPGNQIQGGNNTAETLVTAGTLTAVDGNFSGSITVAEHIYGSRDTAGRARLKPGASSVRVTFDKEYRHVPIVTFSVRTNEHIPGRVFISDEDETGFTISHSAGSSTSFPIEFNWIAIGVEEALVSISDGTQENVEVTVGEAIEATPTVEPPLEEEVPAEEETPAEEPAAEEEEPASEEEETPAEEEASVEEEVPAEEETPAEEPAVEEEEPASEEEETPAEEEAPVEEEAPAEEETPAEEPAAEEPAEEEVVE